MSKTANTQNLYLTSIIFSGIAAFLLLFTDYGGLYYYGYYVQTWVYVNVLTDYKSTTIISLTIAGYIAIIVQMQKGVSQKMDITPESLDLVININKALIALQIIGFIAFIIEISYADDWWFDTAFYATTIATGVNTYVISQLRNIYYGTY